jgi:hypothetical protein
MNTTIPPPFPLRRTGILSCLNVHTCIELNMESSDVESSDVEGSDIESSDIESSDTYYILQSDVYNFNRIKKFVKEFTSTPDMTKILKRCGYYLDKKGYAVVKGLQRVMTRLRLFKTNIRDSRESAKLALSLVVSDFRSFDDKQPASCVLDIVMGFLGSHDTNNYLEVIDLVVHSWGVKAAEEVINTFSLREIECVRLSLK